MLLASATSSKVFWTATFNVLIVSDCIMSMLQYMNIMDELESAKKLFYSMTEIITLLLYGLYIVMTTFTKSNGRN